MQLAECLILTSYSPSRGTLRQADNVLCIGFTIALPHQGLSYAYFQWNRFLLRHHDRVGLLQ